MQDSLSEIIYNKHVAGSYWRIGLATAWEDYAPGQFVMLEVPGKDAFLRRPFGIVRLSKGVVELCYKVVGKGTLEMSGLKAGSKVWVLGPIGRGFKIPGSHHESLLVAGGYGIAPLLGLAEKITALGNRSSSIRLFYGARKKEDLLYLDEFRKTDVKLHIATEDGSMGVKGLVTDLLSDYLQGTKGEAGRQRAIYACGPGPMLSAIQQLLAHHRTIAPSHQISCQLSLESYMACGIGVCIGCVVKDVNGNFVRVCKEGPVFDSKCVSV